MNRTRVAERLDEIQDVVANTPNAFRNGASLLAKNFGVGFITRLDGWSRFSSPAWLLQSFFIADDCPTEIEIEPNDYEADSNREHAEDACAMLGKCHDAGGA